MTKFYVDQNNVDALALGAVFLGSGGGGDPGYDIDMAKYCISQNGPVKIIDVDSIKGHGLVLPLGFMGAPLVSKEKLQSGKEFKAIIASFKKHFGEEPIAIMPAEVGGSNGVSVIIASSLTGLPVIDGDLIGRAFPELQMASANIAGISASPAFISDDFGNVVTILVNLNTDAYYVAKKVEDIARAVTVACGSSVAIGMYPMVTDEVKTSIVSNTISQAITIGNRILSRISIEEFAKEFHGRLLCTGEVVDIDQSVKNGFLEGDVKIKTIDGMVFTIRYQNEYLVAYDANQQIIAVTPDIIAMLDIQNCIAITTENLSYGVKVSVIAVNGPDIWYTKNGLALVGKEAFGI